MDPTVMVYNNEDNIPESSGVVRFHGKFEGRTEPTNFDICHSIKEIQNSLNYEEFDFEDAPARYQKAGCPTAVLWDSWQFPNRILAQPHDYRRRG
jgi:hypothetical protein